MLRFNTSIGFERAVGLGPEKDWCPCLQAYGMSLWRRWNCIGSDGGIGFDGVAAWIWTAAV